MKRTEIKTTRQLSAGGVVFRRAGGGVEVALVSVKGGRVWTLPKGLVEEGENIARTAHREVREEAGLEGRIVARIAPIHYFYSARDEEGTRRFLKIVYFFLMEYTGGDVADHDEEVVECRWFPVDEAEEALSYDDEREVLRKARRMLAERGVL
ncbi:MAG TPA: NUDIX hydrolase [Deltaproteobacteria bacterium]|nr:NUDIX hydrolase [Deltaproteobacteria bacterium]